MSDNHPPEGPHSGSDKLHRTAGEAREAIGEKAEHAKQQAWEAADKARARAEAEADRVKRRGANQIHRWADALERASEELGENSVQGEWVRQASRGLDEIGDSLEGRSLGDMVNAVSDFGRRNPTALLGGAMLAGFAVARFATARRPAPEYPEYPQPGQGTAAPYRPGAAGAGGPNRAPSPAAPAHRPGASGSGAAYPGSAPGNGAATGSAFGTSTADTASPGPKPFPGASGPSGSGHAASGSSSGGEGAATPGGASSGPAGKPDDALTLTDPMRSGETRPGAGWARPDEMKKEDER